MLQFIPRNVNVEDGRTPVMYNREIDEFAHALLNDYRPELLNEPGKIDAEHFLESYLGAEIQFHDIYNENPAQPIFALTTFTKGVVEVFDQENECISGIVISERTVILDNAIMETGKEGLALFSALHECGHLILHWHVFLDEDGYPYEHKGEAAVICCRRNHIESFSHKSSKRTPVDWREHQADYFAAAIAMPNATFYPFVNQLLRENGVYKRCITVGRDSDLDILADDILPEYISETYGVSKRAARIKLRKCEFVIGGDTQPRYKR
jgi:Zn-dependent peptidase ImmA (M78 family)